MKKLFAVVLALCLLCGAAMAEAAPRILIAYVSRAGENYNVGVTDPDSASAAYAGYIEKGNTEIVAETIAGLTGGDLYQITTVESYPDDYASMLTRAQEELDADARPELAGELPNLEDYDIIMIGYPIWHGATPRPVLTFLESYDLTGKKLVPFNTHEGSTPIIGIVDFKDLQMGGDGTAEQRERWLGSINIEIYKDGEKWVPGAAAGESTPGVQPAGRRLMALRASQPAATATMYFAYHNDDAADLNIKFIRQGVSDLMSYLSDGDFSALEPTNKYVIDAVYAEQGGSEDGLKYRYNWMSSLYGGQLDNVKGGSTVKVYVTTKHQVKYYLDKRDGSGYQELTGEKYKEEKFYTTPGTENAVKTLVSSVDYVVDEDHYVKLLNQTPSDSDRFKDERIVRGEYSEFLYKFDDYEHVYPVPALPAGEELPSGTMLDDSQWVLRDPDLAAYTKKAPSRSYAITGTAYGTGNTVYAYKGASLGDTTNTYHLYASVLSGLTVEKIVQNAKDGDADTAFEFTIQLDDATIEGVYGDMTFEKGKATITLKGGESKTASGLPTGLGYTVEETVPSGWKQVESSGTEGTIVAGRENLASFKNEPVPTPTPKPTPKPTPTPTPEPTPTATAEPTATPTPEPTPTATAEPTATATTEPTAEPTATATAEPTATPRPLTTIEGRKVWDDEDNAHGTRPEAITVHLYAEGALVTGAAPAWTRSGSTWTYRFVDVPARTADGAEISYTVREEPVEGYTTDISGLTITNHLIPRLTEAYTDIEGTKTWNDDDDARGLRPDSITVPLYRDGVEIERRTVRQADGWSYRFENLPEDDGYGNTHKYTLRESAVSGYFSRQVGYDLVNTLLPVDAKRSPDAPNGTVELAERKTGTPPPAFQAKTMEEMEDLLDLLGYDTPLWGMLATGDETPVYPYVFGGAGALAVLAAILPGRRRRKSEE